MTSRAHHWTVRKIFLVRGQTVGKNVNGDVDCRTFAVLKKKWKTQCLLIDVLLLKIENHPLSYITKKLSKPQIFKSEQKLFNRELSSSKLSNLSTRC